MFLNSYSSKPSKMMRHANATITIGSSETNLGSLVLTYTKFAPSSIRGSLGMRSGQGEVLLNNNHIGKIGNLILLNNRHLIFHNSLKHAGKETIIDLDHNLVYALLEK
ncbi:Uncharacterised protein [Candidatus Tiddalikarchaeum anstoanum]|nr:Uncharacterised protein [Candidatus Tiddalikarchaeum anstoanum]